MSDEQAKGQVLFKRQTDPVSILYKSIAGRYRPVRVADGPITTQYRFTKTAYWGGSVHAVM